MYISSSNVFVLSLICDLVLTHPVHSQENELAKLATHVETVQTMKGEAEVGKQMLELTRVQCEVVFVRLFLQVRTHVREFQLLGNLV